MPISISRSMLGNSAIIATFTDKVRQWSGPSLLIIRSTGLALPSFAKLDLMMLLSSTEC